MSAWKGSVQFESPERLDAWTGREVGLDCEVGGWFFVGWERWNRGRGVDVGGDVTEKMGECVGGWGEWDDETRSFWETDG